MDYGSLFLVIVAGIALGGYFKEMLLYKTAHLWANDEAQEDEK